MGKPSSRKEAAATRKEAAESRADRKFEKKVQFYEKVKDTVSSLTAQKAITKNNKRRRQKKLKAYDLSVLSEFLPESNASSQKAPEAVKLNCKTRQTLVLKEGLQMKTVLNHPAFQSDPLGSIYQHLQNTQPFSEKKAKKPKVLDPKVKSALRKAKKKKSKASKASQSMEL